MADCESVILCVHDWWIQVCKCKNWNQTVNLCLIDHSAVDMLVKPRTPGAQVRDWRAAAPDVCVCMCVSAAVINVGAVWGMGRAVCAEWCGQGRLAADSTLMTERVMTEPQTAGRRRSIYSPRWRDGREGRDAAQKKTGQCDFYYVLSLRVSLSASVSSPPPRCGCQPTPHIKNTADR